jgi:hypothetical protein
LDTVAVDQRRPSPGRFVQFAWLRLSLVNLPRQFQASSGIIGLLMALVRTSDGFQRCEPPVPARNIYHDTVATALTADGWTITDDPLRLSFGGRDLFVDLKRVIQWIESSNTA